MIGSNSRADEELLADFTDLEENDGLEEAHARSHGSGTAHPHVHDEESLRRTINQLSRIEGHVRGIKGMIQDSCPCPDVLIQLAAVRGAIDRVSRMILDEHLTQCIARAAQEGNIDAEIEELKAALDRFLPLAKKKPKSKVKKAPNEE
ncbi:metal-sensitive transcriptional regulator [Desertifilum sp. FACHB-1129]|uniref:Transcriptional regulator n=3 Tax=Cyanophyceae TaxID=3028117 RepID=A0A1E5QGU3_9CYAN|nr:MULTISPECIES: metal-sensitive transcriptional regulator [Cyanophyceae]MDA0209579.1 metal-sensitive transcriptional regulator [Cyanobacteria bacterium FC1]MDI9640671.1 metal-sensitive transcriptional regulator [Geitlerinema splendidum]MBD2312989.1 metal-sensitive transcriptional regulator [Desertifilum sp. FACHB-1129]MBD2320965.1 metal-sensitive transcriptional regulator [Desertifilum sp. FACHB-866]MBD2331094.1 metal-sensitive transcriptional regulator [Desertifilum sp. FACHB-868]